MSIPLNELEMIEGSGMWEGRWKLDNGRVVNKRTNTTVNLEGLLTNIEVLTEKDVGSKGKNAALGAGLGFLLAGPVGTAVGAMLGSSAQDEMVIYCELADGDHFVAKIATTTYPRLKILQKKTGVTEEHKKQDRQETIVDDSLDAATKECPDCAETIKIKAKVCRYCRHVFSQQNIDKELDVRLQRLTERNDADISCESEEDTDEDEEYWYGTDILLKKIVLSELPSYKDQAFHKDLYQKLEAADFFFGALLDPFVKIDGENRYTTKECGVVSAMNFVSMHGDGLEKGLDKIRKRLKGGVFSKAVDVNAQGSYGITFLHCACIYGNDKAVKLLIDEGIDISSKSNFGANAVHWTTLGLVVSDWDDFNTEIKEGYAKVLDQMQAIIQDTRHITDYLFLGLVGALNEMIDPKFPDISDYPGCSPAVLRSLIERFVESVCLMEQYNADVDRDRLKDFLHSLEYLEDYDRWCSAILKNADFIKL